MGTVRSAPRHPGMSPQRAQRSPGASQGRLRQASKTGGGAPRPVALLAVMTRAASWQRRLPSLDSAISPLRGQIGRDPLPDPRATRR